MASLEELARRDDQDSPDLEGITWAEWDSEARDGKRCPRKVVIDEPGVPRI